MMATMNSDSTTPRTMPVMASPIPPTVSLLRFTWRMPRMPKRMARIAGMPKQPRRPHTSEAMARVRLLDAEKLEPGDDGWAQVVASHPIVAVRGDLFIIRSSADTLGGGEIVDPYARRHRRFRSQILDSLQAREGGTAAAVVLAVLETRQPIELAKLPPLCHLSVNEVEQAAEALAAEGKVVMLEGKGPHSRIFSSTGWERLGVKVRQAVEGYHRGFPLRHGMPKGELRSRLTALGDAWGEAIGRLVQDGVLAEEGSSVRLPSHRVQLDRSQQERVDSFLRSLAENPYSPPARDVLDPELINLLIERRQVVDVGSGIVFATSAYNDMVKQVTDHIAAHGKITVGEVRDLFGTSRKYALALMEHLDSQKITRRIGDERGLR